MQIVIHILGFLLSLEDQQIVEVCIGIGSSLFGMSL